MHVGEGFFQRLAVGPAPGSVPFNAPTVALDGAADGAGATEPRVLATEGTATEGTATGGTATVEVEVGAEGAQWLVAS